jgi:hypothetical protein
MRSRNGFILGIAVIALTATLANAAGLPTSGIQTQTSTITRTGASSTETRKLYWSGDRSRTESYTTDGEQVQIQNGRTMYLFAIGSKEAIKENLPANIPSIREQFLQVAKEKAPGKKIGTGTVAGFKCDIYKESKGKLIVTRFVSTDPRFPLPIKSVTDVGVVHQEITTTSLQLNARIADSMFSLPKGMKAKEIKAPAQGKPSQAPGKR